VETTVVLMADNGHQLLESFFDYVTTGPSGALVGGNTCMEGQFAGNDPVCTHMVHKQMYRHALYALTMTKSTRTDMLINTYTQVNLG